MGFLVLTRIDSVPGDCVTILTVVNFSKVVGSVSNCVVEWSFIVGCSVFSPGVVVKGLNDVTHSPL